MFFNHPETVFHQLLFVENYLPSNGSNVLKRLGTTTLEEIYTRGANGQAATWSSCKSAGRQREDHAGLGLHLSQG